MKTTPQNKSKSKIDRKIATLRRHIIAKQEAIKALKAERKAICAQQAKSKQIHGEARNLAMLRRAAAGTNLTIIAAEAGLSYQRTRMLVARAWRGNFINHYYLHGGYVADLRLYPPKGFPAGEGVDEEHMTPECRVARKLEMLQSVAKGATLKDTCKSFQVSMRHLLESLSDTWRRLDFDHWCEHNDSLDALRDDPPKGLLTL